MPSSHKDWMQAMIAEYETLPHGVSRWQFALGCLQTATYIRCKTRLALALIGRISIGVALIGMGLVGLFWSSTASPSSFTNLICVLCLIYAAIGIAGLFSLNWLSRLAAGGLFLSSISWGFLKLGLIPALGIRPAYLSALSIEASGMMLSLLLITAYLKLIHDDAGRTHGPV